MSSRICLSSDLLLPAAGGGGGGGGGGRVREEFTAGANRQTGVGVYAYEYVAMDQK